MRSLALLCRTLRQRCLEGISRKAPLPFVLHRGICASHDVNGMTCSAVKGEKAEQDSGNPVKRQRRFEV